MGLEFKSWFGKLSSLIGLFLIPILAYTVIFNISKREVEREVTGISFEFEGASAPHIVLWLTSTGRFEDGVRVAPTLEGNLARFNLNGIDLPFKRFRLDFEKVPKGSGLIINNMIIESGKDVKVFDREAAFRHIILHSNSIELSRAESLIMTRNSQESYDPYLIFSPLLKMVFPFEYYLVILGVFLGGALLVSLKMFVKGGNSRLLDLLLTLFVICIPLKIAWTTFVTLLLLGYTLVVILNNKAFSKKNGFQFLLSVFVFSLLFGRPDSFGQADLTFAYIMFAVLALGLSGYNWINAKKIYTIVFFVICGGVVIGGINLLISFDDFYGESPLVYFQQIKSFGVQAREWLIYDHPAFLSFFGLVGLLFSHKLYKRGELEYWFYVLYSILLFFALLFLGARIGVLIYLIFQCNLFLLEIRSKWFVLLNLLVFISFASILIFSIPKIDSNRNFLWRTSLEAIGQRPLMGYGISRSEVVLNDSEIFKAAGFDHPMSFNHSHNQFVTFLIEYGVVGSVVLLVLVFYFLAKMNLLRNRYFVVYLFGLGYVFMTESILLTSKPLYTLCFVFLLFAYEKQNEVRSPIKYNGV